MKEWLSALKVAKDIVKGGISAYKAGEIVDALIAKSVDDYDAVLTENEKDLYEQYKNATDDFWYVNYNGKLGYVLSRYLD